MLKYVTTILLAAACTLALAQPGPLSEEEAKQLLSGLQWYGPGQAGDLDGVAKFTASEKYTFLDRRNTDNWLRINGNPPPGTAVTVAPVNGHWFGILTFDAEGYIKDDEKIDADALLKTLRQQNEQGNEARRAQGYGTMELQGWALAPRYDRDNQRLEWGTLFKSQSGEMGVNVSTRILGRSGFTSATLVTSPATMESDLMEFKAALKDFDYVPGQKYSEWREGDKVAAYGLGALVVGGAAAAMASKGGFKVIGALVLGGIAAVWGGMKRLVSRKKA